MMSRRSSPLRTICCSTAGAGRPRSLDRNRTTIRSPSILVSSTLRIFGIRDLLLGAGLLQALNQADHRTAARWLSYGAPTVVTESSAARRAESAIGSLT